MDRERQMHQGRLAIKKQEAKAFELKIKGLLESVRLHLDPLEKIAELEIDVAFSQMTELVATWAEYKEILADIKAANKILGRE
jgi:hypothetical protein